MLITLSELSALAQVVVVDLVLAGDNAIVVGLVAAGLPRHQRAKVIMTGIVAATVLRVAFAVVTTRLLQIIGLTLAGGLLLLWVTWKLWREIKAEKAHAKAAACGAEAESIRSEVLARRASSDAALVRRFVQAKADGDLPEEIDPEALARYLGALLGGLSVQAGAGVGGEALGKLVDTALAMWPGR